MRRIAELHAPLHPEMLSRPTADCCGGSIFDADFQCWIRSDLARSEAFLGGILAVLVAGGVEIKAAIVIFLTVSRAGAATMRWNGKCRTKNLYIRRVAHVVRQ
jgi:hypothetical protein